MTSGFFFDRRGPETDFFPPQDDEYAAEVEQERDWGVWCQISGGITGTREAWLRRGIFRWSGSQDEAETLASKENARAKGGVASYRYTAKHIYLEG